MHRVILILPIFTLSELAHGACEAPVSIGELQATFDTAMKAYGREDIDSFTETMAKAREQIPCVTEEITPSLAAELHRLEGMAAFTNSARKQATAAFAAARALEPQYTFPTSIVPLGNPLLEQYVAKSSVGEEEQIPPAKGGKVMVDGQSQRKLPTESPAIVQVFYPNGDGDITEYHWPGDPLPYKAGTLRTPVQTGLLLGGAAVAVAGVATMIAGGVAGSDDYQQKLGYPPDMMDAEVRGDTMLGIGVGGAAAGIGAIGFSFLLPTKEARQ